jgi:hypothetical protein
MKIARSFNGRWTSFFATTYSVELEFFDEYLFRRLGEPPLAATILVDAGTHARLWTTGGDVVRRLRRANRDYLLRPVLFGTGAFHPKTYLLGNATEGTLLVGSGNLTMGGIEQGHEVFTQFHSGQAGDVGTIHGWRRWMDSVVERLDDDEVTYRWLRLRKECSDWLEGEPVESYFVATGDRSILDQEFAPDERPRGFPVHLTSAWPEPDGRVTIELNEDLPVDAELTAGGDGQPLKAHTTVGPLAVAAEAGVLVWLRASDGGDLSNRVPLDDRRRLGSWLEERVDAGARPRELDSGDFETPVGQMLLRLHEACIFDIDDTPALARAGGLTDQEAEDQSGSWEELEELLAKEELARDPRIEYYRRGPMYGLSEDDDVLGLLQLMLDRAPAERGLRLVGGTREAPPGPDSPPGTRWAPTQRLRVRLFNVLQRWSLALADPRFVWIDPTAPARNYAALLVADAECWEQEHLPEERVVRLLGTLLGSFVRTERSPGYLLSVSDSERQSAIARVSSEARDLGGALIYCALRPGAKWRDYLFAWQPALVAGLDLGVFDVSGQSCDVVERLIANRVSEVEIRDRLQWAAAYIDDEKWAERQERDLGFEHVRLTKLAVNPRFGVTLQVSGVAASLDDARVVSLLRQRSPIARPMARSLSSASGFVSASNSASRFGFG